MTAKARWSARLTVTALAAATLAALTVAAPAHADRAQDCETLMNKAQREFYLYEWTGLRSGTALRTPKPTSRRVVTWPTSGWSTADRGRRSRAGSREIENRPLRSHPGTAGFRQNPVRHDSLDRAIRAALTGAVSHQHAQPSTRGLMTVDRNNKKYSTTLAEEILQTKCNGPADRQVSSMSVPARSWHATGSDGL